MKKIIIILILFTAGAVFRTEAQYGFGTSHPDPQAIIDMTGSVKGLLIPRVALTSTDSPTPLTTPITVSMLVYNTATSGVPGVEVTPGFYYWSGSDWVRLAVTSQIPTVPSANLTSNDGGIISVVNGDGAVLSDAQIGINPGTDNAGKVLTVNSSGDAVWTPGMKWFYMPGFAINTQNSPTPINLYNEYASQFTNVGVRSMGAPANIQVIPAATDLYYYVTSYDSNVFASMSIDADGVMTYTLTTNSPTDCSFINVVFVIK